MTKLCETNRDLLQTHSDLQIPSRIQQQHQQQQQHLDELKSKVETATTHFAAFDDAEASIRRSFEMIEESLPTLLFVDVDDFGDISKQIQKSDNLKVRKIFA